MEEVTEMAMSDVGRTDPEEHVEERRSFFGRVSGLAMAAGLVGGYGAFGAIAVRYLYPDRGPEKAWLFVAVAGDFRPGTSRLYTSPDGARITIARRGDTGEVGDFTALSSVCPHLGCQVHWEAVNNRFFCPCHNGVFAPDGKAISGPPGDAGQTLSRYPLRIDKGLLFIEAAVESLTACNDAAPPGPGHDPCLYQRFPSERA